MHRHRDDAARQRRRGGAGPGPGRVRRDLRARAVLGRRCRRGAQARWSSPRRSGSSTWSGWSRVWTGGSRPSSRSCCPAWRRSTSVEGEVGGLLSEDDIALASGALHPGTSALMVVVEDRWAAAAGGRRASRRRRDHRRRADSATPARAVPAIPSTPAGGRAAVVRRVASSRRASRRPAARAAPCWTPWRWIRPRPSAVHRVDQLRALLHLVERGVLSAERVRAPGGEGLPATSGRLV